MGCVLRRLLTGILVLIASSVPVLGHVEGPSSPPGTNSPAPEAIGLQEHLGQRIPMDATFRDESGRLVSLGGLVGGPTIILPVYYSCTNVCNYLQSGLARVLPEIDRVPGRDYWIVSVSIDENETPAQAARAKRMYMSGMKSPISAQGWRFLTGDAASIRRLTDAAGYQFERKGRDFIHPVASFVVTADGTIVRYLYGTSFLAKDVSLALIEAREGRVGQTVRKVMEYCFTYDPKNKTYVFNLLRVSATVIVLSAGSFLLYLLVSGRKAKK